MNPITLFLSAAVALTAFAVGQWVSLYLAPPIFAVAILIALSVKVANVWQKFVILRVGKLQSVKGAGFFMIIPVLDSVVAIIDERIQTTAFNAEQALTKDTVPVNVDAIIFWHVHDAQKAALAITDYRQAIDRVAQTSLREMIGSSMLAALLSDRKAADAHLRDEIGGKTADWGITVRAVEIRTSRFQLRCRTPCPGKLRPSVKSRLESSWGLRRPRSPPNSSKRLRCMKIIPARFSYAR
jgi:regulator of protease activity HflC (stomatin/prohibitin superfamily)